MSLISYCPTVPYPAKMTVLHDSPRLQINDLYSWRSCINSRSKRSH